MRRVTKGMTVEEVRAIWLERSEAKTKAILDSYHRQHATSAGREGLGIYGRFQKRVAREKVRLAVRLLEQAGHEVTESSIRKVTRQSLDTIRGYWTPPTRTDDAAHESISADELPPPTFRFPRT